METTEKLSVIESSKPYLLDEFNRTKTQVLFYLGRILPVFLLLSYAKSNAQSLSVTITSTNVYCGGEDTGSATATAMGGVPPYTYFWSNWETTPTINNLYAGTYDITITDDVFSEVYASVTIIEENPPLFTFADVTNVSCYGGSDGSITAVAEGGESPYFYNWSNGSTDNMISNLTAGYYSLTVMDNNNCSIVDNYYVSQPEDITIEPAELNNETCLGAEDGSIIIVIWGGVNPISAEWSNGETGLSISDLSPGLYTVTVTDNNDCTQTASFVIDPGSVLNVNLLQIQHVSCNGESDGVIFVNATGNAPPYTYMWSNGMTTPNLEGLTSGTYTLTTTDANVCEVVTSYTINEPPTLSVTITQTSQNLCFGDMNVDLSANVVGGTPGYIAVWSNGVEGMSNNNLAAGTYTVTVTDNNDCTKTATSVVTVPADLEIGLVDLMNETCASEEDGSITIEVFGGVSPVLVQWSNGLEDLHISDLVPGTYDVTVTDENGCSDISSFSIDPGPEVIITLLQLQNVSCNGDSNAAISVIAAGGETPYDYIWSNGMTGPSITELTAGTYIVTVTEYTGCAVVENYIITEPTSLSVSLTQTSQNLCFGDTLAGLVASAAGGTPAYTALWSDGTTGLENINLGAGVYTISVTDANSCLSVQSAIINAPAQLSTIISTTNETGYGANDGTASSTPSGGTPGYSYLWSNGATTSSIANLAPGSYTVTVTDMNGCTVSNAEQVLAFGCLLDVTSGLDYSICEDETSSITPLVTGASGPVSYLWTDSSTTETLEIMQGGEYCVTVTDAGNCQNADCIVITEIVIPPFTCPVTNESGVGANDGAIQCDSMPGNVMYVWSNGATTSSIAGLSPGEYCVTITDTLGCSRTQCFNVQPANCLLSYVSTVTNVNCHGQATGAISLNVTGATEPVTYTWSNGANGATIDLLAAGNYTVTIADANGCLDNGSFTITEPLSITITLDSVANADETGSGLIWITVSGGTPGYGYHWIDPTEGIHDSEDLNGLMISGYYFLEVTDTAGCIAKLDSVFVDRNVAVEQLPNFKPVKVYPVPAGEVLFIDIEKPITEIVISRADGRLFRKIFNPGSNRINVSDFESGWYVLRIYDGEEMYMARMVK